MSEAQKAIAQARDEFMTMVAPIRPELHRYCARLTGSVVEGEDIVQDTLAKAFFTIGLGTSLPPLRPWLFRIAHNAALDFLKSHGHKHTELREDMADTVGIDDAVDPLAVRAAIAKFLALPLGQRSAVILKDVLGHSLEECAETMGVSVMAVKASLVRGRGALRTELENEDEAQAMSRAELDKYASLFNARDWDGLRALIGEDCRLDLVSKAARRGKEVGMYFGQYAKLDLSLRVLRLEGQLVLGAYAPGADRPSYFILLNWADGRVESIRDYRYVPYIASEAEYQEA
jgi:RNA polymerase sigma factor (sigma-70 family)